MEKIMRSHADAIVKASIHAVMPDEAVARALKGKEFPGRVLLVSAGKAAWQMAKAANDCLGDRSEAGVVVTKYEHVMGPIANYDCREAGHPVPDENSFSGTQAALDLVSDLTETDTVLFLLSGGGSALFEKPLVSGAELQNITGQLLACGASIVEMNTIRKRLSAVKGGRFAQVCAPAHVFCIVLSDILGDPLDMIASGPACPDTSTCAQALNIVEKYNLKLSDEAKALLAVETPKKAPKKKRVLSPEEQIASLKMKVLRLRLAAAIFAFLFCVASGFLTMRVLQGPAEPTTGRNYTVDASMD